MNGYLWELGLRLGEAAGCLPDRVRQLHGDFLVGVQRPDGGFAGRSGPSDLYYTGFGLRALAMLGRLEGGVAGRAAGFLSGRLSGHESIVDLFSLLYAAKLLEMSAGCDCFTEVDPNWPSAVADLLAALRRPDGGYAKTLEGAASSTYQTFLVVLCHQLIGRPLPDADDVVRFIRSQACDEGGFREIRASKRPSTNPTAAAIAVLRILDALDGETRETTIQFLASMQNEEGGFTANTRIPIADGLSTFTALWTLSELKAQNCVNREQARRFVASLQAGGGGFSGAAWDGAVDVEYTFYGLGALALMCRNGTNA